MLRKIFDSVYSPECVEGFSPKFVLMAVLEVRQKVSKPSSFARYAHPSHRNMLPSLRGVSSTPRQAHSKLTRPPSTGLGWCVEKMGRRRRRLAGRVRQPRR